MTPTLSPSSPLQAGNTLPSRLSSPDSPKSSFGVDIRYVPPFLITAILIAANTGFGVLEALPKTLTAIGTAIVLEILLSWLINRRMPHLASAYVSGISCGILVRSPEWWPYIVVAAISITSKYVIRVKGRHLWNPSNLGIAVLLFLAPQSVASLSVQWGNNLYPMLIIWVLGAVIVSRMQRLHICAVYVASFLAFSLLRSQLTGHTFAAEVAPITGPMYQLFVFFMITDPKTTVTGRWAQALVAFLVAAAECALRLNQNVHAPYFALFLVGPPANLIDIYVQEWRKRKKAKMDMELAG